MSEDILKEYQDLLRVNGMSDEDINTLTSIEEMKIALRMQKKLNAAVKPDTIKKKILPISQSRENAQAIASDILRHVESEFLDPRYFEGDERFARDNMCYIDQTEIGQTLILRDKEGRLA